MTKTLLIIVGISCAVITAAGIMWSSFNKKDPNSQRFYDFCQLVQTDYAQAKTGDQDALARLRKLLDDKDAYNRSHIISVLAGLPDKESIPKIRELLNDKDSSVRGSALYNLSETYNDKTSIPVIRKSLKDNNYYVRYEALSALTKLDDKESLPDIRKMLNDESFAVQSSAVGSLGKLGDKESIPAIRKLLNSDLRFFAVTALGRLNDQESIPKIKEFLKDKNIGVRRMSFLALRELGVPEAEIQKAKEGK